MQKAGDTIHLTASDLVGHLNCRYLTKLDLAAAKGELAKPSAWDPVLELLAERGDQHEKAYVAHLAALPRTVVTGTIAACCYFRPAEIFPARPPDAQ